MDGFRRPKRICHTTAIQCSSEGFDRNAGADAAPTSNSGRIQRIRGQQRPNPILGFGLLGPVCLFQIERDRIHAVARARRLWTVWEDVTEVRVTAGADHFGPKASDAAVFARGNALVAERLREARPAGAGLIFRFRAEQFVAATRAAVDPGALAIVVLATKRSFGALLPTHLVLLRGELGPPFGFALGVPLLAATSTTCFAHHPFPYSFVTDPISDAPTRRFARRITPNATPGGRVRRREAHDASRLIRYPLRSLNTSPPYRVH